MMGGVCLCLYKPLMQCEQVNLNAALLASLLLLILLFLMIISIVLTARHILERGCFLVAQVYLYSVINTFSTFRTFIYIFC